MQWEWEKCIHVSTHLYSFFSSSVNQQGNGFLGIVKVLNGRLVLNLTKIITINLDGEKKKKKNNLS